MLVHLAAHNLDDDDDDHDDDGLVHLAAHNLEAKQSRRRSGQRVLPGADLINLNISKSFCFATK